MSDRSTEGVRWGNRVVTFSFAAATYAKDVFTPFDAALSGPSQDVVRAAFAAWHAACGLDFVEVPDSPDPAQAADIRIGWSDLSTGAASDVIGHAAWTAQDGAFAPDVLIQLEDPADIGPAASAASDPYASFGTSLMRIALHEIGHAIGLAHSDDPASVMFPVAGACGGSLAASDVAAIQALYPPPSGDILIDDPGAGLHGRVASTPCSGADADIHRLYVHSSPDGATLWATEPGTYVTGGAGDDAIAVVSGNNVLDGGGGSNFLVGGTGRDTFFVAPGRAAFTWDTIENFHPGDAATIWGYVAGVSTAEWRTGEGAAGAEGATLHVSLAGAGRDDALVTFSGMSAAQAALVGMRTGESSGVPYLVLYE